MRASEGAESAPGAGRSSPRLGTACLEEGLARLEYLVTERRNLGVVVGPAGSGKTFLARHFTRIARRDACDALLADVTGIDGRELVWTLLTQLGVRRSARESRFAHWRALADRLAENRYERRPVVLLLDNIERASTEVVDLVMRLVQGVAADGVPLTCVLLVRTEQWERVDGRLRELVELRIEMEPWNRDETREYAERRLGGGAGAESGMDTAALDQLVNITGGAPRDVTQLLDLTFIAHQDQPAQPLDAPTMVAIFEELSGQGLSRPLGVS